jgi:hypothetical protein
MRICSPASAGAPVPHTGAASTATPHARTPCTATPHARAPYASAKTPGPRRVDDPAVVTLRNHLTAVPA